MFIHFLVQILDMFQTIKSEQNLAKKNKQNIYPCGFAHWVVYAIPVSGNCIHQSVAPPSGVRELLTGVRGVSGVFQFCTRGTSTKNGSYTTHNFWYTSRWRHRVVYGIPVSGNCIHHSVPDSAGVNILLVFLPDSVRIWLFETCLGFGLENWWTSSREGRQGILYWWTWKISRLIFHPQRSYFCEIDIFVLSNP